MQELRLAFVRPGRRPAARWYQGGFLSTHHRPLWRRSRGADTIKEQRLGILIAGRREFIMATVSHAHIEPNAEGEPIIAVTRIKVRMIALDRIARGWDAEEIQRHHPDLSLGQIHSALAYYFDHKQEMGRDIADRHERVTRPRAGAGESTGPAQASGAGPAPVRSPDGEAETASGRGVSFRIEGRMGPPT